MKRKTLLLACFTATSLALNAQQAPTGSPVPAGYTTAQQAASAWYRGGNNSGNTAGINNIFGTVWNSPIYTITDNTYRTKLNGNVNYTLSGYAGNRNGNLLIGVNTNTISTGQSIYSTNFGAFSLLHINGPGSGLQEFGYRPWMQTGITFTGNRDLSYFGLRQVGTGEDVTETTITWSDNSGTSFPGPDDMVFRFTGNGNGSNLISTNYTTPDDLDGLHIARFAPTGEFGLGNTFGINAPGTPANLYVRPQSLIHLSLDGNRQVWSQYTNQTTGQTQTDGLRMGIAPAGAFVNGYLRWQENTPFIVQSAYTASGATAATGERMRVTSIGALNNTEGNFGGLTTPANRTRIAISADGANPITKPLSLLHLGYNTGAVAITPGTDGWRSWMDIGMFTSNGTDNVYLGLKDEGGLLGDRQDAVLT